MPHSPDPLPPIELAAPDISVHRTGNLGVDYVSSLDSGRPGPHVMLQALTHGNELCGAIVLDELLCAGLRPDAGRMTVVFANVQAYQRWNPADPDLSRFVDEDYNRVWDDEVLSGPRDSVELRRARELGGFVARADFLLDIHSMREPCPPMMVCGVAGQGGEKGAAMARAMGVPRHLLIDTGHPAGRRMIEHGGYSDPASKRVAVLIECGQHWERSSVAVAREAVRRFLDVTGVLAYGRSAWTDDPSADPLPESAGQTGQAPRVVRVTHAVVARSPSFRFAADYHGLEVIERAGEPIAYDEDEVIRAPYDNTVLVMPSKAHLKVGTTTVRLGRFED
ncbi:MAG TPA: succinylglutamate desuccinylase/aspartoacylase family protein [Burkholderiaceae bacterium]|jgi:predicted deacylase|nr:succinylglutamate desuccinylase/aspartoacylase family protein [Burkholderiaceae bacterium]